MVFGSPVEATSGDVIKAARAVTDEKAVPPSDVSRPWFDDAMAAEAERVSEELPRGENAETDSSGFEVFFGNGGTTSSEPVGFLGEPAWQDDPAVRALIPDTGPKETVSFEVSGEEMSRVTEDAPDSGLGTFVFVNGVATVVPFTRAEALVRGYAVVDYEDEPTASEWEGPGDGADGQATVESDPAPFRLVNPALVNPSRMASASASPGAHRSPAGTDNESVLIWLRSVAPTDAVSSPAYQSPIPESALWTEPENAEVPQSRTQELLTVPFDAVRSVEPNDSAVSAPLMTVLESETLLELPPTPLLEPPISPLVSDVVPVDEQNFSFSSPAADTQTLEPSWLTSFPPLDVPVGYPDSTFIHSNVTAGDWELTTTTDEPAPDVSTFSAHEFTSESSVPFADLDVSTFREPEFTSESSVPFADLDVSTFNAHEFTSESSVAYAAPDVSTFREPDFAQPPVSFADDSDSPPTRSMTTATAAGFDLRFATGPWASPPPDLLPNAPIIIRANNLVRTFRKGNRDVPVLRGVDLEIREGEFVAITGASGSGKTTLLHCLAGLDDLTSGTVVVDELELHALTDGERSRHRSAAMGFAFQTYNLVPSLTALENVELPLMLNDWPQDQSYEEAQSALALVGLADRADFLPQELSGGEQQRIAIARAFVGEPKVVWADEPTGNLDDATSAQILQVFRELNHSGLTIVMVTHDLAVASLAHRVIELAAGQIYQVNQQVA